MTSRAESAAAELTSAGLWLGPLMLASHVANGVYQTVCEGRSDFVTLGWITVPPIAQLSMVFAFWLAWVVKDLPLRVASLAFALHQFAKIYEWMAGVRLPESFGWLGVISALLLTILGMRRAERPKQFIAPAVFVLASVIFFAGVRYGNVLSGRDSVFREAPICNLRNEQLTPASL